MEKRAGCSAVLFSWFPKLCKFQISAHSGVMPLVSPKEWKKKHILCLPQISKVEKGYPRKNLPISERQNVTKTCFVVFVLTHGNK